MSGIQTQLPKLRQADIRNVRVGGEIGRRIQTTIENNLLAIDVDGDFLRPFQERTESSGYVGLGKLVDSLSRCAAYSGDERLLERRRHVMDATLGAQQPDGYLGMMAPEHRINSLWDAHEMAYLVLGLANDYRYFQEPASLDGARKLADYLMAQLAHTLPPPISAPNSEPITPNTRLSDTGLHEALLVLGEVSGDSRYRDHGRDYRYLPGWNQPIVLGRWGAIHGHAYAYLARSLAQLKLYPFSRDPKLLDTTRTALTFLLEQDGLVASGTCGDHECWHDTQSGTSHLGETCATAYFIRWCDTLLKLTGSAHFGDLIERSVFNAMFGAQSPDGRRLRYYTPFEAPRVYYSKDTYCCPGNFRRIISELPLLIAYGAGDGAFINLYTESDVRLDLADGLTLRLRQETDYPNSGEIAVHVEPSSPGEFPLGFRAPIWSKTREVRVNGKSVETVAGPGGFHVITREWRMGDTLQLNFPMEWRFIRGRRTQEGRATLMRGPQIFAFNPERNPAFEGIEPRLTTLDPASVQGTFPDDSVRPGGMACRVSLWKPGTYYPAATPDEAVLTEFADPGAALAYFHVPNPKDERLAEDELTTIRAASLSD